MLVPNLAHGRQAQNTIATSLLIIFLGLIISRPRHAPAQDEHQAHLKAATQHGQEDVISEQADWGGELAKYHFENTAVSNEVGKFDFSITPGN